MPFRSWVEKNVNKTMKKNLLFMLPVMALCLASCEKNNGNENKPAQNLVKSMMFYTNGFSDLDLIERRFEYDAQGGLTGSELLWDGQLVMRSDITYEDNMIVETLTSSEQEKGIYRHYLNEEGYLIKSEGEDNWFSSANMSYEYEKEELVRVTVSEDYGLEEYTYHWNNGDITGVTYDYDTDYIEYYDVEDNFNIDYAAYWRSILDDMYFCSPSMIKFKGTTSKHLPHTFAGIELLYEFDADGDITKIKVLWEGGTGVIEIEYVDK